MNLLLKKWELLWNHYKLQDENLEKRRNFLWIIESFTFAGWYYIFAKLDEKNTLKLTCINQIFDIFTPDYANINNLFWNYN